MDCDSKADILDLDLDDSGEDDFSRHKRSYSSTTNDTRTEYDSEADILGLDLDNNESGKDDPDTREATPLRMMA